MPDQFEQSIFGALNPSQSDAVRATDGPIVVFAGAGSGKTRVITSRIAYLINNGIAPQKILALTFTNRAATEMKQRALGMHPKSSACLISTFHSCCARWLREFAEELGYNSNFTIFDDSDSKSLLKKVLESSSLSEAAKASLPEYKHALSSVKTEGFFSKDLEKSTRLDNLPTGFIEIYKNYQSQLFQCNAMDFGDLMLNMILLLRNNLKVKSILQNRFAYIMVDEYQDTNRVQVELITTIAAKHQNICIVGDDDQSIYSWRGALAKNILEFDRHFANLKTVKLEQNYRCTGNIIKSANQLISNNKIRAQKELWTENPDGALIDFVYESDNEMEASHVVDSIRREEHSPEEVAVFYRTNSQSRAVEEALLRENIAYQIYGATRFYDRVEIKDLVAYLRLLVNPLDDVAFLRVVNKPARKIGQKSIEKLQKLADASSQSLLQVSMGLAESDPKLFHKLSPFLGCLSTAKNSLNKEYLGNILNAVVEKIGYLKYLEKKYPNQLTEKVENVHELVAALNEFQMDDPKATLDQWLQNITLVRGDNHISGFVSLMTLHMAKGLEFERVYIMGFEDGLLPHKNSIESAQQLEEERRLLYVGITRAKRKLTLTSAYRRLGYQGYVSLPPSRFLAELPPECIAGHSEQGTSPQLQEMEVVDAQSGITQHQSVYHPTYGYGMIEDIIQEHGRKKAIVEFDDFGKRTVPVHHLRA